jgi:hypothetical protein
LRLLTFLPLRPLLSVPLLRFFIARSTSFETPFEYLRAILLLLKPTIMVVVANAIGLMLVTIVCKTLFPGSKPPLEELRS